MIVNRSRAREGFPLATVGQVRRWFEAQLDTSEPDLVLLSIVVGHLEHQWTASGKAWAGSTPESAPVGGSPGSMAVDPPLSWHLIEASAAQFEAIIRSYCDSLVLSAALSGPENNGAAIRALIKHVADIIWNTLSKSHYKDRPHLQSIYSYLTGNKLDCFGVAFAVVASCQLLEVPHVHLALSEDHAWVVFGAEGTETAEVTWHGKGNEDKRGQPVDIHKAKTSWLYLAGQPVVCDRHMEVAALVSSINPAVSANVDSVECGVLQQELLWLLYDQGHLSKYPMALGNLADLEEIEPSLGRPSCQQIFDQAIRVNRDVYANHHVYPYTYQAGYHYRLKEYKAALKSWANAAEVIKRYCYSKDDEEIYKEFLEIANELIPHTVKAASLNPQAYSEVLQDPECFASILQFYDGICCWEEGSPTPVLHIGWAKPMVSTCSKFEAEVRARVEIPKEASEDNEEDEEAEVEGKLTIPQRTDEHKASGGFLLNNNYFKCGHHPTSSSSSSCSPTSSSSSSATSNTSRSSSTGCCPVQANDTGVKNECDMVPSNDCHPSSPTCDTSTKNSTSPTNSAIVKAKTDRLIHILSQACKENILNVNYLLGETRSKPFLVSRRPRKLSSTKSNLDLFEAVSKSTRKRLSRNRRKLRKAANLVVAQNPPLPTSFTLLPDPSSRTTAASTSTSAGSSKQEINKKNKVYLELHSAKMRGLKDLLCSEKLNTSAIQLQLTAQSQTDVKRPPWTANLDDSALGGRPKRTRRE